MLRLYAFASDERRQSIQQGTKCKPCKHSVTGLLQDFFTQLLATKADVAACDFWEGRGFPQKYYQTNMTKSEVDLGALLFKLSAIKEHGIGFLSAARWVNTYIYIFEQFASFFASECLLPNAL